MTMMQRTRFPAQLFLLLALILVPALFYTGYELFRLSEGERQIAELYERQLDAILFSVNQYAWDISGGWLNALRSDLDPSGRQAAFSPEKTVNETLPTQLSGQSSLLYAAVLDSAARPRILLLRGGDDRAPASLPQLADSLASARERLHRLHRYRRTGYRKIESVLLPQVHLPSLLALTMADTDSRGAAIFHLVCIDSEEFIRSVLGPKFRDLAGAQRFVLVCRETATGREIVSTGETGKAAIPLQRRLWLFPDYSIGIRLEGETIEELTRSRSQTSIILFSAVGLLLLAGAWLLYRSFRRELQLADMKTDFVSNVSHELKTPLALIRMYAETLEMGRVPDDVRRREYLGIIVKESERLTQLINNILTFSRIESGRKEYRLAPADLDAVVRDITGVYRFHLEHKGFRLELQLADGLPTVIADEEAVAEALLNLLDNAMKYSDERKNITVRTGCDASEVWVEVEDRGIGIPAAEQRKIFEKFYRVTDGLVHTAKGSGLGLALVDHIMKGHGGRISLHSVAGEGSRFRLVFPITPTGTGAQHGTHPRD